MKQDARRTTCPAAHAPAVHDGADRPGAARTRCGPPTVAPRWCAACATSPRPATTARSPAQSWHHGRRPVLALGAKAAFPDRQVIAVCGDGGLSMLMGDLITAVQERLPIKVAVFNNGSLGFVELEQHVEGMMSTYTDLQNPDFSKVAEAVGYWGQRVERAEDLDEAVKEWLAQPGPALLDVITSRYELIMPPAAGVEQAFGMALYSMRAVLAGHTSELVEMAKQNFIT